MMILWEDAPCSIQHIGHRAILNSNTLTPLLKKLQKQGLIDRQRNATDERSVRISLTISGKKLKKQCQCIPGKLIASFPKTSMPKLKELKEQLDELIKLIQDQNEPA
jgi:DNA-binding MarR family transcriptional regulator